MMLYCNNFFLHVVPSKKALFEDIQKRALKMINGQRDSVKLERARSTRNKMCALEIFNALHGLLPNTFQNYLMGVNHGHCTPSNTKNIALDKFRSETGKLFSEKKTFSYQGAITFYKFTDELKSETSIIRFKTLSRDFYFEF